MSGTGGTPTSTTTGRLAALRHRIELACTAAGRDRHEITLVAVTKGVPASRIVEVLHLGVRDLGENKAQEAAAKAAEITGGTVPVAPRWHFIGQLQRNKVRLVAGFASMVHSVDRLALVAALDRAAQGRSQPLDVLIQIDLDPDPEPDRGGVRPEALAPLVQAVLTAGNLGLRGVMALAAQGVGASEAFDRLRGAAESVQAVAPSATVISAGMSGDLEAAISAGATHVRVGTALFGARKLASD